MAESRVQIVEELVPEDRDWGEVLLEIKACGICGSDVHMARAGRRRIHLLSGPDGLSLHLGPRILRRGRRSGAGRRQQADRRAVSGGRAGVRRRNDLVRRLPALPTAIRTTASGSRRRAFPSMAPSPLPRRRCQTLLEPRATWSRPTRKKEGYVCWKHGRAGLRGLQGRDRARWGDQAG